MPQEVRGKLKIAVYSIAKDEQQFVRRFMDSCAEADVIVVGVDSGDTTGDLLAAMGARVLRVNLPRFRFDQYRNEVLKHIPADVDVCISLDLDEVLPDGWRQIVEKAWRPGVTRLNYRLQWSPDNIFSYNRIHARHGYIWRHANHEAVYAEVPGEEVVSDCQLIIYHYPDVTKDRSKNLPLLELAVEEEPRSTRMRWYLAREFMYEKRWVECIEEVIEYFTLDPTWDAERSWAAIFAGRSYLKLSRRMDGIAWFHAAVRNCVNLRDPYFELALHYYDVGEDIKALEEIENALKIEFNVHQFFEGNGAYSERIYVLKTLCHEQLDELDSARRSLKRALRINPECQDVIDLAERML